MNNTTIDLANLNWSVRGINSVSFSDIVINYCDQWSAIQSAFMYDLIWYFWFIVITGILSNIKFFDINIHKKFDVDENTKWLEKLKLNEFVFNYNLFEYLNKIGIAILLFKIFQIYYINAGVV